MTYKQIRETVESFIKEQMINESTEEITPEAIREIASAIYSRTGTEVDDEIDKMLSIISTTIFKKYSPAVYQKFSDIEVIIPTFAMSAGTMISLASNRLIMGRQSQLGPIDPQLAANGRSVSARAIVDQFNTAKKEIMIAPASAAAWAPALQSLGPALLQEAQLALDYGEAMVSRWLGKRHFAKCADAKAKADAVAKYFNRSDINHHDVHKSHGRRIDRDEARSQGLDVIDLESDQQLQDIVLTNYHLATLVFEKSTCTKFILGNHGKVWMKNIKL